MDEKCNLETDPDHPAKVRPRLLEISVVSSFRLSEGKRERGKARKTGMGYEQRQEVTERAHDGPFPHLSRCLIQFAGSLVAGRCEMLRRPCCPLTGSIDQSDDRVTRYDGCPDLQTTTNPRNPSNDCTRGGKERERDNLTLCLKGKSGMSELRQVWASAWPINQGIELAPADHPLKPL